MYRVWKVTTRWRSGPSVEYQMWAEGDTAEVIQEEAREAARVVDPYDDAYGGVEVTEEPSPPTDWLQKELERVSAGRRVLADREAWLQRRLGVAPEPPPSYATSGPQRMVLLNLLQGRFPDHHLRGMSQFGGHQKVMAALYRKKMVENYRDQDGNQADRLTDLGREIAKYWAEWGEPLRIDQHQKCPHDKYPTLGDECGVCAALGMRR